MKVHVLAVNNVEGGQTLIGVYSSVGNAKAAFVEYARQSAYDGLWTYEATCEGLAKFVNPVITETEIDSDRLIQAR
jgi:hypothetical protein